MTLTNNPISWSERKSKQDFNKEANFLHKLDNTIQHTKNINIIESSQIPYAATDMKNILLNLKAIKQLSNDDYPTFFRLLRSFNYHEICHILYTKYSLKSVPWKIHQALNLLEDQRIETMFSTKYPSTKKHFKKLAIKTILGDGYKDTDYLLIYGRRYILEHPTILKKLRKLALKKYTEETITQAEDIIDTYVKTMDVPTQIKLATELYNLIPNTPQSNTQEPNRTNTGRNSTSKEEKEISKEIEKKQAEEKQEAEEKQDENGSQDTQDKPTTEEEDAKQNNTDKEEIEELEKEVDDETAEDIEQDMNTIGKHSFDEQEIEGNTSQLIFLPNNKHQNTMKQLKQTIKRMRNDLDNKTEYNQKKGKLDMRRAMQHEESHKIEDFKRYIPSRLNKTRLAVSILLDSSGSMENNDYETAISSGWAIATALEESGSKVKVYEFSEKHRIIKDFNEQSSKAKWGRDGNLGSQTYPESALKDTIESLDNISKKDNIRNQLVILLTDGAFNRISEVEQITKTIKNKGIFIALIRVYKNSFQAGNRNYNEASYNKVVSLKGFEQLTKQMIEIVKKIQLETVKKIRYGGN